MKQILFTLILLTSLPFVVSSQNVIQVGNASYAEYPLASVDNTDFYGMSWAYLRDGYPFSLHADVQNQPVPTNDWWTDMIFNTYAGNMWAYPHAVSADNQGLNVIFPNSTEENRMSAATQLELKGSSNGSTITFSPFSASPKRWSDIDVEFRMEQSVSEYIDVTMAHGVPYVWAEFTGIEPVLTTNGTTTIYNQSGSQVTNFPASMNTFVLSIDGKYFGIHTAAGTEVNTIGGNIFLNTPNDSNYIVISMLPNQSFINSYDIHARNKITNTTFSYNYNVSGGKVSTTFDIATQNLDNAATGGNTIMSFMPHQWRETSFDFNFIPNADYTIYVGKMHTAIGKSFTFNYNFGGMLPSMPEPLSLTEEKQDRLYNLITDVSINWAYAGDTYNKGLDEVSELMLVAHELGHPRYEELKESIKGALNSWLTFDPAVDVDDWSQFFAFYPNYGALIGFRPGYGSQGFNDLHFHYGYYVLAGARLAMVDEEFKAGYGEILRLLAKTYANHTRYGSNDNDFYPWLRTFDPYVGHSWAGGVSSPSGNNQESLSEAIMSWWGIYNLGVALRDQELIDLGAMGWVCETRAGKEYWFDVTGENFPQTYPHEYVGIFRASEMAHATYFSADPGWVSGIHFVPSGHYMSHFSENPIRQKQIWESNLQERVKEGYIASIDYYSNIMNMGQYLGGFHLGYYSQWDPNGAVNLIDQLYANNWHLNGTANEVDRYAALAINTAYTNATYGHPAEGYSTSLPTGAVYEAPDGTIITLIYNYTSEAQDVTIYKYGNPIDVIRVQAGKTYNSLNPGPHNPTLRISKPTVGTEVSTGETILISAVANDKDGLINSIEFLANDSSIETFYTAPFEMYYQTTSAGTLNITAKVTDNDGRTASETVAISVIDGLQSPYTGTPTPIPGSLAIWQYDNGGEGIAYHDLDTSNNGAPSLRDLEGVDIESGTIPNIGWAEKGEWIEYTVNIQTPGVYEVSMSKSAPNGNGQMHLELDNQPITSIIDVSSTGAWGNYNTQTFTAYLNSGTRILKMYIDNSGFNIRNLDFTLLQENYSPSASAGENQIITLPVNSVTLSGSGTDPDNNEITYKWSKIVGGSATITSPTTAVTNVTGLVEGTYVFRLSVSDGRITKTDDVQIIVNPEVYQGINIALNKPVTASSIENLGTVAEHVNDGSLSTRWSSAFSDPQWIQIDLLKTYKISDVTLIWETAASASYEIQISNDANNWTTIYSTISGNGGVEAITGLTGSGRYIRMYSTARMTPWGNSIYEFEVYGTLDNTNSQNECPVLVEPVNQTINLGECATIYASAQDANGDPLTYSINGISGQTNNICDLTVGTHVIAINVSDGQCTTTAQVTITVVEKNVCVGNSYNGDYQFQVTNDGLDSYLTFIPGYPGVGDTIILLYYSTDASGIFPGYLVSPNTPNKINAKVGETVYFYYTYSLPEGGERNTMDNKHNFVVGNCVNATKASSLKLTNFMENEDVDIYPNPAKQFVNIKFNSNKFTSIRVINLIGQKIFEDNVNGMSNTTINVENLKTGAYYIQLIGNNKTVVKRIIKN